MDLISRHAESLGRDMLGAFPAVVISGARQVGKSTLAGRLVRNIPHLAVTLDDESTRAAAQADSRAFVEQFTESTLVIDEVQRYPELSSRSKRALTAIAGPDASSSRAPPICSTSRGKPIPWRDGPSP